MDDEFGNSELGTLEYWNNRYKLDMENYQNFEDVGEIWFGENIVGRIVQWLKQNVPVKDVKIIDIGCGNGMLCIQLHKEGYSNIKGIDYCVGAIELATQIAKKGNYHITYEVGDILQPSADKDCIALLDKGTYDAISLTENSATNRSTYIHNVSKMMNENSVLILTSCNWTVKELSEQFSAHFVVADEIATPQFVFGGKIGNTVALIVLKLKHSNVF